MLKGIAKIKKETEEAAANASKNRIRWLGIRSGEGALIRFLTEPDEVISAEFHTIKEMTPRGDRYTKKYCSQDETCKYCAEGLTTGEMLFLWTYCYYILHKQQNLRLDNDSNAEKWTRVKIGEQIFFKEDIMTFRVFRTGPGKGYVYKNTLIKYADEYGTYLDRDYKWTREGAEKDTTAYALIPKDPKPITSELKNLIKTLPDLAKVVSGEITSFEQVKDEVEEIEEEAEGAPEEIRIVEESVEESKPKVKPKKAVEKDIEDEEDVF